MMDYDNLRRLALVDAKRRLHNVVKKIPGWTIIDRFHSDGSVEKAFVYHPTMSTLVTLSLNDYGQLREIKYIVWRFNLLKEELEGESDGKS